MEITVIAWFPLVMSVFAAGMVLNGEADLAPKIAIPVLTVVAVCCQFVPGLADWVHFTIPLVIQLIVWGWWYLIRDDL